MKDLKPKFEKLSEIHDWIAAKMEATDGEIDAEAMPHWESKKKALVGQLNIVETFIKDSKKHITGLKAFNKLQESLTAPKFLLHERR